MNQCQNSNIVVSYRLVNQSGNSTYTPVCQSLFFVKFSNLFIKLGPPSSIFKFKFTKIVQIPIAHKDFEWPIYQFWVVVQDHKSTQDSIQTQFADAKKFGNWLKTT